MMVFVQPVTDDEIRAIQERNKEQIEKAQHQMLYPDTVTPEEELDLDDAVESETVEATIKPESATTTTGIIQSQPVLETETKSNTASTPEVTSPHQDLLNAITKYINNHRTIIEDSLDSVEEVLITLTALKNSCTPLDPIDALALKLDIARKAAQSVRSKINHISSEREAVSQLPKLYGMEISIENIVRNRVTDRPTKFNKNIDWKVVYTINEFKTGSNALWTQFVQMKNRREKALSFEKKKNSDDFFLLNLRRLAKQGKKFREEQDRIDAEKGIVVYEELNGATGSGPSSISGKGKQ